MTTTKLTHHVEVLVHEWIRPLLGECKRSAGETGDEDNGGLAGVTSSLRPDLGAIRRGNIYGKGGGGERESGEN